ncbi:MAG: glucosamine-6-phosphate deaminase [Traorella sp.]
MRIIITDNYEQASLEAFKIMKEIVVNKPNAVLGLATGSTPLGLYKNMIEDHKTNGTSYKDVTTFNLDEYVGLGRNHRESYYTFMHQNLFSGIDIKEENIHLPYGNTKEDCDAYEKAMEDYQVDIQLLGIGGNGHIGFNEPGTPFDTTTHIVDLQERTRKDNARFFDNDINQVPTQAITMGIATIMKAKKVLLIATGINKKEAVFNMVLGEKSINCPASALKDHPDVVVILDRAAAKDL